jgi:hypothetical protein
MSIHTNICKNCINYFNIRITSGEIAGEIPSQQLKEGLQTLGMYIYSIDLHASNVVLYSRKYVHICIA